MAIGPLKLTRVIVNYNERLSRRVLDLLADGQLASLITSQLGISDDSFVGISFHERHSRDVQRDKADIEIIVATAADLGPQPQIFANDMSGTVSGYLQEHGPMTGYKMSLEIHPQIAWGGGFRYLRP